MLQERIELSLKMKYSLINQSIMDLLRGVTVARHCNRFQETAPSACSRAVNIHQTIDTIWPVLRDRGNVNR